jgi:uncharacterized protein YbjT (DUF2867 family)
MRSWGAALLSFGLLLLALASFLDYEAPSTAYFVTTRAGAHRSLIHTKPVATAAALGAAIHLPTTAYSFGIRKSVGALLAQSGSGDAKGTIVVIGATGQTGSEAVYQALQRGHKVIGLARTPSKLVVPAGSGGEKAGQPLVSPNLKVVAGSVVNVADVRAALDADDVVGVVVALGGQPSEVGKTMLTDGTRNVIEAMKAKGLKRVSVVTSIGTGDSLAQAPFFFRVLMSTVMSGIFEDKNNQEALFLTGPGADLEYTIVRPGGLTLSPPSGKIDVIGGEAGAISRADVASFCLDAVTQPDWQYLRRTPCISSPSRT